MKEQSKKTRIYEIIVLKKKQKRKRFFPISAFSHYSGIIILLIQKNRANTFFFSSEYMSLPYIWPPTPADTISGTL